MIKTIVSGRVSNPRLYKQPAEGKKPGYTVLNFSVASNTSTKAGGTQTDWVACRLWGARAEALAPYLFKGQTVFVEGRPKARAYTLRTGESPRGEIVLDVAVFEFVGPRPKAAPATVEGEEPPEN